MLVILKESGEGELEAGRLTSSYGTIPMASSMHVGTCCEESEAALRAHLHTQLAGVLGWTWDVYGASCR